MPWKGFVGRVGLITAVSVIVGVNTLSPLLKQPSPANDEGALPPFSSLIPNPGGNAEPPIMPAASDRTSQLPSLSASNVRVSDEPAPAAPHPALPSLRSASPLPSTVGTTQLSGDERSAAAAQSTVEALQAPPIVAATEPPKAEKRTRAKRGAHHSTRIIRPHSTPFSYSYDEQLATHWDRARVVRPRLKPFSYTEQLAPQ
jgi:hypothetical protein